MSTQFTNRQWRLPNNENKDKQSNYSMDFDGTQLVSQGVGNFTSFNGVSECSVSLWFKSSTSQGPYKWFFNVPKNTTGNHGFGIYASGTGLTSHVYTSSLVEVVTNFSGSQWDGNWHHLVLTYKDGVGLRFYYDSVLQFTNNTMSGTITAGGEELAIGGYGTGYPTGNNIIAQIDGVSAFTYALSQSQITTLYGSSSTGIGNPMSLSPAPVAYYPLGDQDAFNGADYLVPNSSLKDYVFDFGGSSYIDLGNLSLGLTANSISIWFKTSSTTSGQQLLSKMGSTYQFQFRLETNGTITLYSFQDQSTFATLQSASGYNDGNWHNVITTFNTTDGHKMYVDGNTTPVDTDTANKSSLQTSSERMLIGVRDSSTGVIDTARYFNGDISNAQIFNSALSATGSNSVETLYNNGSPLTSMSGFTSLQGWWKLDASATYDSSTTTWTIPDDSSNSNDGTSSGMTQANLVQSDLSFTSGYSPYALNFDGANDYIEIPSTTDFAFGTGGFTISLWVNFDALTSGGYNILDFRTSGSGTTVGSLWINSTNGLRWYVNGGYLSANIPAASFLNNTWYNVIILNNGSTTSFYLNGTSIGSASDTTSYTAAPLTIGDYSGGGYVVNGSLSNVSIWNADLTSAQVTEIYNEGVPSNLNNHSAYSSLVSWWQLGSNTSWVDPYWISLDEKGTNNGESQNVAAPNNMGENAIVDGVGSYANGLSSGMSDNIVGSAPFSDANSLSVNMDVEDRTTDTPS
jgi:hypothetical protein